MSPDPSEAFVEAETVDTSSPDEEISVAPAHVGGAHSGVPVWISLAALALGGLAIGTTEFATMGVLPQIADGLRVSIPKAGYSISSYALGVVVGAPLFAIIGARLPRKRLALWLAVALAATNLCSAAAGSFTIFVVTRFLSGLPHGAYFGTAAVLGASLVPAERRARAIAQTMMGLMVANVVGVPVATWLGQAMGWRSAFIAVGVIAVATVAAVAVLVPTAAVAVTSGVRQELSALRRPQVWLTWAMIAAGFGGMFAVYSYIAPTLTSLAGYRPDQIPIALAAFGIGMTLGNLVGGRLADWSAVRTIALGLVATAVLLATFTVAVHAAVSATITLLLLGFVVVATLPALTVRLMDAAREGRNLAAASFHSAFNIANAIGASLGGAVVAAGFGYTAPADIGAGLAVIGLVILGISVSMDRFSGAA
jgi:MFS transporter, DHA1 family, inner membrane transport protein